MEARRRTGDQRTVPDVFQRSDVAGFLPAVRGHALIDVVAFEVRILDLADQRRVVALTAEFVKERGKKRNILPAGVQTEGALRPRLPVAYLDLVGCIPVIGDRAVGAPVDLAAVGRVDAERLHAVNGVDRTALDILRVGTRILALRGVVVVVVVLFLHQLVVGFQRIVDLDDPVLVVLPFSRRRSVPDSSNGRNCNAGPVRSPGCSPRPDCPYSW